MNANSPEHTTTNTCFQTTQSSVQVLCTVKYCAHSLARKRMKACMMLPEAVLYLK